MLIIVYNRPKCDNCQSDKVNCKNIDAALMSHPEFGAFLKPKSPIVKQGYGVIDFQV
jgi:hypothetical protein